MFRQGGLGTSEGLDICLLQATLPFRFFHGSLTCVAICRQGGKLRLHGIRFDNAASSYGCGTDVCALLLLVCVGRNMMQCNAMNDTLETAILCTRTAHGRAPPDFR